MKGFAPRLAVAGQFMSAGLVLALAGICVALLPSSMPTANEQAGLQAVPGNMAHERHTREPAPHTFIIVVSDARAEEFRLSLLGEANVREGLREPLRDAEVLRVATEADALVIVALIEDQATIPGVAPMVAVIADQIPLRSPSR